jgi:preprotein translocase SecF subunit
MNFVAGVTATKLMTVSIAQNNWLNDPSYFLSKRSLEKKEVKIHRFYERRKIYYAISAGIMVLGIIMTIVNGINLDIQFQGGSILRYTMSETIDLDPNDAANLAGEALGGRLVTGQITNDFASGENRLVLNIAGGEALNNEELQRVTEVLQERFPDQGFEMDSVNNVSPFFGQRFLRNGIISIILSGILIIAYVWFSFRKIHGLSAGAMSLVALVHDVLIAFFVFTIFGMPIGDNFVAVALTILGYSINDTIVIYDRIRENAQIEKDLSIDEIVDKSISQSFTRSLNTNLAVFASIAVLYIFAAANGLDSITSFALPLAIGSISGCYSTICLVGPLWTSWQKRKERKRVPSCDVVERQISG